MPMAYDTHGKTKEGGSEHGGGANGTGAAMTSLTPLTPTPAPKGVPLGLATPTRRGTALPRHNEGLR